MVGFRGEGKTGKPREKAIGAKARTNNKLNPHTRAATPHDGLYRVGPPKRATFFRLKVYERVGISLVEVYKKVGERNQKG